MLYRKKTLLALVELFNGELNATDFQKLLFIFSQEQIDSPYEFVPYKYGCFSFQAMADKNKLITEEYLECGKNWKTTTKDSNYIDILNAIDKKNLYDLKQKFENYSTYDLIRYVYKNYPYFAIHSTVAKKYLSADELVIVDKLKPSQNSVNLFTIGYEGRSLERYLNALIINNIKVLCDVRKNPLSRKYGFAKKTLQNACDAVNIKYLHLPELGIVSEKRKHLKTRDDYDALFEEYEKTVLATEKKAIKFIHSLLENYGRVALTCYEAAPDLCHRTRVANAVHSFEETIPLTHL